MTFSSQHIWPQCMFVSCNFDSANASVRIVYNHCWREWENSGIRYIR